MSRVLKNTNKFSLANTFSLVTFNIKNTKKSIIGWSIAIFAIMFLYMILFSSMKDIAQVKIDSLPEGVLKFMGVDSFATMLNYISYYGMIYNIMLIPISIFATTYTSKIISSEETEKSIEYLYSLPVSRNEIFISKIITSFFGVTIVIFAGAIATVLCGYINGGSTFILMDFIQILKISSFTPYFFSSLAILIAGITTKIANGAVSSLIALALYFLGYLSSLLGDKAMWLEKISPFVLFNPTKALVLSNETFTYLGIYLILFFAMYVLGTFFYKKRDFNI